ncbi:MAG TPA: NAD(P)/FAD-dependent oxidoreductase [Flavisolibacter sp.]|nr:NAD(P)/FAD-dependent oxidoreductase [Flavisolibacter sp.]
MTKDFDVTVIGAGQAGLSASYYLKQLNLSHLVIEKGRIGESWLSQRWNSFRMNTANKLNTLPGDELPPAAQERFGSATALAGAMRHFAASHDLPVREHARLVSLDKDARSGLFAAEVDAAGSRQSFFSRAVIVASGAQSEKKLPAFTTQVAAGLLQLHSSEYRHPSALPAGAVLIVGSGQSGCQIAEDLAAEGRKVYLSTSRVPRCPRRYRGKDIMDWLILTGFFDTPAEAVPEPSMLHIPPPLLKGTDAGKKTLSLQALARKGVRLLGRMQAAAGHSVSFENNAADHMAFGDAFSGKVKGMIDAFIAKAGLDVPPAGPDPDDEPVAGREMANSELFLDLKEKNINTIIWATGFRGNFDYTSLPLFDAAGNIIHNKGASTVEGLYFLGLHWLRTRKSNLLFGIREDAQYITDRICAALQKPEPKLIY